MYFLVIFFGCLFLCVADSPVALRKISSQLQAFQDAVAAARVELSHLRDSFPIAGDDDRLLHKRRRNIDQLLANFQKDAAMADQVAKNDGWASVFDEQKLDVMCGGSGDKCAPKKKAKDDYCKKEQCERKRKRKGRMHMRHMAALTNDSVTTEATESKTVASLFGEANMSDGDVPLDSENYLDAAYNDAGVLEDVPNEFEDSPLDEELANVGDANYVNLANDQVNTERNDLSHEANYKLSKIEQDAAGKRKPKGRRSPAKEPEAGERIIRFNPMNEIKLKTSSRMMRKGYGASLPSSSLRDFRRDLIIDDMVKKMERNYNPDATAYEYDKYRAFQEMRGSKQPGSKSSSNLERPRGGYDTLGLGISDIDRGRNLNGPAKRFITPRMSAEYDEQFRDKRFAALGNQVAKTNEKKMEASLQNHDVPLVETAAKVEKKEAKSQESKVRVKRIESDSGSTNALKATPEMLKADFAFVSGDEGKTENAASLRRRRAVSSEDELLFESLDFDSMERNDDDPLSRVRRSTEPKLKNPPRKRRKRSLALQNNKLKPEMNPAEESKANDLEQLSRDSNRLQPRSAIPNREPHFRSFWFDQDMIPSKPEENQVEVSDQNKEKNGNVGYAIYPPMIPYEGLDRATVNSQSLNMNANNHKPNLNEYSYEPSLKDDAKDYADDQKSHEVVVVKIGPLRTPPMANENNDLKTDHFDSQLRMRNEESYKDRAENALEKSKSKKCDKSGKQDELIVHALRDEIMSCTSVEKLENIIKKIRSNDTEPPKSVDMFGDPNCTETKLNFTINATIASNPYAGKLDGNGTINISSGLTEERERRAVGEARRRKDKRFGRKPKPRRQRFRESEEVERKSIGEDGPSQLDSMVSGRLSQQILKSIAGEVHSNAQLKPLANSLPKRPPGQTRRSFGICNKANAQQVQNTQSMLAKAMENIGDIIEQQVRSRTCVPLRPDLMSFYETILRMYNEQSGIRSKRSQNWITDFDKDIRAIDPNTIEDQSSIVKKLLQQYEELPEEDRVRSSGTRDDLLRDLMFLRRVKEGQNLLLERRKRAVLEREIEAMREEDPPEEVRQLESAYTPEFVKLLKVSEIFRDAASEVST